MDPSAISDYLQQGQGQPQSGGDMGAYMDPSQQQADPSQAQPTSPQQRWGVIQESVNQIDQNAQALGIPTFDLFKNLSKPEYTGPNGVNWDKLMTDHKNMQLASKAP